jgi:hypothetical protein
MSNKITHVPKDDPLVPVARIDSATEINILIELVSQ